MADHTPAEKKCKEVQSHEFSVSVKRFAQQFTAFKNKRNKADYSPLVTFNRSEVMSDIILVETVLKDFKAAHPLERVRFAHFVVLKDRVQK